MNYSCEPFFAIYQLFQERIPCYRNFLRARTNHYSVWNKGKPIDETYDASLNSPRTERRHTEGNTEPSIQTVRGQREQELASVSLLKSKEKVVAKNIAL
jgi:hypothetical protein